MPVRKALGQLKSYGKRKKAERARGEAIDKNVRQIKARHALGYRNQAKAKDPEEQRKCIEAQLLNGHTPDGMTQEEAFTFISQDLGTEDGQ